MSTASLRDENERLKALLAQTQAALSEHQTALATSEEARRRLEVILGELRREKFGAKSKKLRPDQYHLPLEDVEIARGVLDAAQEKAAAIIQGRSRGGPDRARHRNRGHLPGHLPRVERIIEPASTLCPCGCGGAMTKIGEDVSERLDVIPAQWQVLVTRRPKYVCRRCSGAIVQAFAPEHVVPGGLPADSDEVAPLYRFDCAPWYRDDLAPWGRGSCWRGLLSFGLSLVSSFPGFGTAQAFTVEVDTVSIVDESIEDGVGVSWIADYVMPS